MEVGPRERRRRRRTIFILAGVVLVVVGIVLLFVSTLPDVQFLYQETFQGSVPPGIHSVPINRTGFGFVELTGEVLPCRLSIYAVTAVELITINETQVFPEAGIDCQNTQAIVRTQATHVVLDNQDLTANLSYRVVGRFFIATAPFAWMVFPGFGVIGVGLLIAGLPFLRGD